MGDCLSSESQQNSPYARLQEGYRYNAMDNQSGGQLISSSSSSNYGEDHISYEQASNRERELQKQLDTAKRELEEERGRILPNEAELHVTLSTIEQELCEYKNQLVQVRNSLESEHRDWEMIRARLETQVEHERLKVHSRDVQIHELKLSKEHEIAALSNQLVSVTSRLETENRLLREQLQQSAATAICHQPLH